MTVLPTKLLLGAALVLGAPAARATLGQAHSTFAASSGSSPAPGARLLATRPNSPSELYSVQRTQLESGTEVREFVGPDGVVFALSWRGPVLPELNALLGGYFRAFKRETELQRMKGRRGSPISIARDGLVIESGGRMRNFFGYAYAAELIPPGVDIKDVQP